VASGDEAQRTAIARALFEEGLKFVDLEKWADAADRFARVLEIRYSPVAAYNYGLAQARLGKLVIAAETLRKLLSDAALDPKVRDPAAALQHEVDAKLGWLTLQVNGDGTGCTLRVDDKDWPAAAWGVAVPVDPGKHTVVLVQGTDTLHRDSVDVAPGARILHEVDARAAAAPTPEQVAANAALTQPEPSTSEPISEEPARANDNLFAKPWFWVAVGVVAAGAITAVAIGASSGKDPATPVRGDFSPGVIEGKVMP
jgi:hypothetical protein